MSIDVSAFKQGQKAMWAAGDYPDIAQRIVTVGEYLAERAGAAPGIELLDVATGSGNVSIPAARLGASVTGLDLTPTLLEAQRARASAEGVAGRGRAEAGPGCDGESRARAAGPLGGPAAGHARNVRRAQRSHGRKLQGRGRVPGDACGAARWLVTQASCDCLETRAGHGL